METLKLGSKGASVKKLQQYLGVTPCDGIFGKMTLTYVTKFQRTHTATNGSPLKVDGIVGPTTWAAIEASATASVPSTSPEGYTVPSASATVPSVSTEGSLVPSVSPEGSLVPSVSPECIPLLSNLTHCSTRSIKFIVVHYTLSTTSRPGTASNVRNYWKNSLAKGKKASCDYVVDDANIICINPDPLHYYSWQVGDGKGKYSVDGIAIRNSNCIGIEMVNCMKPDHKYGVSNSEGYYFTDAVIINTISLVRQLMKQYNIPISRVIRHYDASRKVCPGVIGWNPCTIYDANGNKTQRKSDESAWNAFLQKVNE